MNPTVWAISDIHVGHPQNRSDFENLPYLPGDWLIIAGDVGESEEHLHFAFDVAQSRFARVLWVPGNHELWSLSRDRGPHGESRYLHLVELCRRRGVLTPEDAYARWPNDESPTHLIALLMVLYDYSYRAPWLSKVDALRICEERQVMCADEVLLRTDPWPGIEAWCAARVVESERRLTAERAGGVRFVLVNHFPLRAEMALVPRLPGFEMWCGTRQTEDWHVRFPVEVVVSGHLHLRSSLIRDGVRFEEVSFGYPRERRRGLPMTHYLRKILS
jgi:3',5'-cyclic AMP phosphodiesterase CpdA